MTETRYKTNDATIEKMACLLEENPKGLLVLRDELSGWLASMNKAGREGDRAFYLESWNGYSNFNVDRIGRGSLYVPSLCLSIFGGLQPSKVEHLLNSMLSVSVGDDGLFQRLQILVYPEVNRKWKNIDRRPDKNAFEKVAGIFDFIADLKAESDGEDIPGVRFSKAAQEIFNQWWEKWENRLRSEKIESPVFESHLGKYRSLIPSLSLIFHVLEQASTGGKKMNIEDKVDPKHVELAIKWSAILEAHAHKVYLNILHPSLKAARTLAGKIAKGIAKIRQHSDQYTGITGPSWIHRRKSKMPFLFLRNQILCELKVPSRRKK